MNTLNLMPALPEIFVAVMACAILLVDVYVAESRRAASFGLALFALVGAAALTLKNFADLPVYAFHHMFVADRLADVLKLAIYAATFVVFVYARDYLKARGMFRGEFFALGLFGVVGMMVMASASNFLPLYLGLELLSLSLYAMIAFQRDSVVATEAAMKYFVLGAIASGVLLYGMSLIYGMTRSLDIATVRQVLSTLPADNVILILGLVFVIAGLAFKIGAVPFHMWVPDVYHGAPTAVTLYIGAAPKVAAFALFARLLIGGLDHLSVSWQQILIVLALLSMGLGNVLAIAQDNLKRMLAYSSIAHMGFFLLGIVAASSHGYGASLFYVLVYAAMSLAGFGMITLLSRAGFEAERLEDFKGLNQRSPWYAFLMLLVMFSMAGVPPLAGFYAKFLVIQSVVEAGMVWLAVAAVLFAVIGAYYYLRVVKFMYFDDATEQSAISASGDMRVLIGANALMLLAIAPWIGVLMELCRRAVQTIG